jgi:uncharacterized membrane protein
MVDQRPKPARSTTDDGRRNTVADYVVTLVELLIVVSSVGYVAMSSLWLLLAWMGMAATYLFAGAIVTYLRSTRGVADVGRSGALDVLAWVFPLAASVVGVAAAVQVLVVQAGQGGGSAHDKLLLTASGATAIIIAWMMLHWGFAHVYLSALARDEGGLEFPADPDPDFGDLLYFSFTIGTTFATSDVTVATRRVRWIVLVHSVAGFFYNAIVIAVAIQVIQQFAHT